MTDSRLIERAVTARREQFQDDRQEPVLRSEFLGEPSLRQESRRLRPREGIETTVERAIFASGRVSRHDAPHAPGQFGVSIGASPVLCGASVEALKANLWVRFPIERLRTILVIGAAPRAGASTLAWDLASSFASDDKGQALLIDADLGEVDKHPRWSKAAQQGAQSGMTLEALLRVRGAATRDPGTGQAGGLFVLPAGDHRISPLALFHSPGFDRFLDAAEDVFTNIVIDGAPIAGHPESLVLAAKVDGIVLVIESERTRRQSACWTKQQIEAAGGSVLGVVLNKRTYRIPDWLYKRM